MNNPAYHRDKARLRQNFNKAAAGYDKIAILQRTIGERLLERLDVIKLAPRRVLELGSGTGRCAARLSERYPQAGIIQLDLALNMLTRARQARRCPDRSLLLCADLERLPLADACVEFVFSNLAFQWVSSLDQALAEARRTLRPGGLLLFSTFGPDSLMELRESWARVDDCVHVNAFMDMHDVGDALLRAGFTDPVMETERMTLIYESGHALLRELKALGASNVNAGRRKSLTGKRTLQSMLAEYARSFAPAGLQASFEAVYGHAWLPDESSEVRRRPSQPGAQPVFWR